MFTIEYDKLRYQRLKRPLKKYCALFKYQINNNLKGLSKLTKIGIVKISQQIQDFLTPRIFYYTFKIEELKQQYYLAKNKAKQGTIDKIFNNYSSKFAVFYNLKNGKHYYQHLCKMSILKLKNSISYNKNLLIIYKNWQNLIVNNQCLR